MKPQRHDGTTKNGSWLDQVSSAGVVSSWSDSAFHFLEARRPRLHSTLAELGVYRWCRSKPRPVKSTAGRARQWHPAVATNAAPCIANCSASNAVRGLQVPADRVEVFGQ